MLRTICPDAGERHASWLELFFDLVFVVAIAQLAHLFVGHPDWAGAHRRWAVPPGVPHRSIPTDPSHLPERFGLFTLIVLGELIVAVSISTLEATWTAAVVGAAVMSFGIALCLWWIYFERLTEQSLPRSAGPVVTYAYAHLPLVAALMYVGSGVSLLIRSEGGPAGAWALCAGVGGFLFAVSVAHAQLLPRPGAFVLRARGLAALVVVAIPLATPAPVAVSAMTLGVLVALVVFEALMCGPREASWRAFRIARLSSTYNVGGKDRR